MEVAIPEIAIGPWKIPRGFFINISVPLIGGIVIPWDDIDIIPKTVISKKIVLFHTEWITTVLMAPILAIPRLVWEHLEGVLDGWVDEYYEEAEEEEKI